MAGTATPRTSTCGAVATPDDEILDRYIGQNTSRQDGGKTVFFGLNSVFRRREAQRDRALNRGEIGRYLVSFLDNHDCFWQPSGRFGAGAPEAQIIAGICYLLRALGIACLYYGTEQGFEGGVDDNGIREAMFDRAGGGVSVLNANCPIYFVAVDAALHARGAQLQFLYGGVGSVTVDEAPDGTRFVPLNPLGHAFVILK